ncbi:MAG: trypsin-like peptidase domain-containing protein [Planctomycetota bacterium]|nr:trypsin-like peptidase domain-containing protein [Planctomycetota bacterium]
MNRIKWYGPTVVLVIAVLGTMYLGPSVARQIAWAQSDAKIQLIQSGLKENPTLAQLSAAFRGVSQSVEPSVVHIAVAARQKPQGNARSPVEDEMLRRFFGPRLGPSTPREEEGENDEAPPARQAPPGGDNYSVPRTYGNGSGWVYDDKGHIITNNHVVDGAELITVRFNDLSERTAKVVGTDPKTDVAVLLVEGGNLHPAARATEIVEQGDIVFAFGSPFRFEFSMSQGIVSAKGRQLHIIADGGYENFIQTDAAINPGNSGGPLCNIKGEVVGMNTAIASQTGAYNGLGFAIPIDMANDVIEQIIKGGKVVRGYLGIQIQELDPEMARTYNYTGKGVLVVSAMEGGPAEKAGIKADDIITKVNGKSVSTPEELRLRVATIAPGKSVPIEVFREGKSKSLDVTVVEQPPQMAGAPSAPGEPTTRAEGKDSQTLRKLGFESVMTYTTELAGQLKMKFQPGVIVRSVRPDSVAASVGIGSRQVIVEVMGTKVKNIEELTAALAAGDLEKGVRVRVIDPNIGPRLVVLRMPSNK